MREKNELVSRMRALRRQRRLDDRFIRTRMWFSTVMATMFQDRGSIPDNIGNNVMIGNNVYITKNCITAVIMVGEMSTDTPVAYVSKLTEAVKSKVPEVTVDVTFKNKRKYYSANSSDMKSRVFNWTATLDSPIASDNAKRRAARLLYTLDVVKSGEQMYQTYTYIMIRATSGAAVNRGVTQACNYLASIGAVYKVVKNDMRTHLAHSLLMSDKWKAVHKDHLTSVMSKQTLAEVIPDTQGLNSAKGTFLGIDTKMMGPYFIDFRATARAKNIVVGAKAGDGKTFLVQNWFLDMSVMNYNLCVMDLKGTEFTGFTRAVGGKILSMSSQSTYYVNTWRLDKSEAVDSRVYFDERINLCKETMMILADLPESLVSSGKALAEEFVQSLYLQLGVTGENVNTWSRTENVDPYYVFDQFERFCSTDIRKKYANVAEYMLTRLRIYMSRNGSSSHMFRDAFAYEDMLETRVLTFDFGELQASTSVDPVIFKLKVLYMQLLNEQYISHKSRKGEWTCKVLEEAGVAADYLLQSYAKDFKLRRSQNQVTVLLGNSISALVDNPAANGILENTNILVIGSLNKSSRDYLTKEFGLEKECEEMENLSRNPEHDNTFLVVNRMEKDATTALLKAYVPKRVVDGKLFRIVDTEV